MWLWHSAWEADLLAGSPLQPGEVRHLAGTRSWFGRSEDGRLYIELFGVVQFAAFKGQKSRQISDDEIVRRVRERLAGAVANAASRPRYPRASPKPLGDPNVPRPAGAAVRGEHKPTDDVSQP